MNDLDHDHDHVREIEMSSENVFSSCFCFCFCFCYRLNCGSYCEPYGFQQDLGHQYRCDVFSSSRKMFVTSRSNLPPQVHPLLSHPTKLAVQVDRYPMKPFHLARLIRQIFFPHHLTAPSPRPQAHHQLGLLQISEVLSCPD